MKCLIYILQLHINIVFIYFSEIILVLRYEQYIVYNYTNSILIYYDKTVYQGKNTQFFKFPFYFFCFRFFIVLRNLITFHIPLKLKQTQEFQNKKSDYFPRTNSLSAKRGLSL